MYELNRTDVLKVIKESYHKSPVIVPLAATVREMYALGPRANEFYVLGSMGMPISIATGLVLGLTKKNYNEPVICIEGDGSVLMNLSSLVTIKYNDIKNLIIFLLDNEGYSVTGNQEAQSKKVDLSEIAKALHFNTIKVNTSNELKDSIARIKNENKGPYFIHTKISNTLKKVPLIEKDPIVLKYDFMEYIKSL